MSYGAQNILDIRSEWRLKDEATAKMLSGAKAQEQALIRLEVASTNATQRIIQNFARAQFATARANIESRSALISSTKAGLEKANAERIRLEDMGWKNDQARAKLAAKAYDKAALAAKKQAAEIAKIESASYKAADGTTWLARRLASLGVAMGVAFTLNKIKGLSADVIKLNAELEQSRLGIAAILYNAGNAGLGQFFNRFERAQEKAVGIYRRMEMDSAKTLSTTQDYAEMWQSLSAPIFKAKGGINEVNEATKLTIATARMLNMPLDIAAFSVKQMLLGMVDSRDQLASLFRLTSKEINALKNDPQAALALIMSKLKENQLAASASADTMIAKWTTFQDMVTQLKRAAGEPLFAESKKVLDEIAKWYTKNKKEARETARLIGEDLVKGMKAVLDASKWIADHWEGIKKTVEIIATVWIGNSMMKGLIRLVGHFALLKKEIQGVGTAAKGLQGASAVGGGAATSVAAARQNQMAVASMTVVAGTVTIEALKAWGDVFKGLDDWEKSENTNREIAIANFNRVNSHLAQYLPDIERREAANEARKEYQESRTFTTKFKDWLFDTTSFSQAELAEIETRKLMEKSKKYGGWNALMYDIYEHSGIRVPKTESDQFFGAKLKAPEVTQDFRGSHFEIKVDARHQDPDRVAASIIKQVGKKAVTGLSQARSARGSMSLG